MFLGLILLGGALLRLSAVGYGNHALTFQPDENFHIPLALGLSWTALNPHEFFYPAFLWYMLFALYQAVFGLGKLYGFLREWEDVRRLFEASPLPFFLLGRTLSVAFGTATLGLVYLLGRRLFSPAHGLLAAAFLAGAYLHVRDSALTTPDAPLTFFIVLSLLGTAAVLQEGRVRDYLLAGSAAGLAAATKYNGVLVLIALAAAHGLHATQAGKPLRRIVTAPRLLAAVLVAGFVFLVLNPYLLLDRPEALYGLKSEWGYVQHGQYLNVGPGWWYHFTVSLRYGMGVGLLGLACLGIMRVLWRREGGGLALLSFAACFFLIIGSFHAAFVRYMTPLLPILCLFAAAALLSLTAFLKRPRARSWVTAGLALLVLAEPLHASTAYGHLVHHVDTRVKTYEFIRAWLPPGSEVATYGVTDTWRSTIPRFEPTMISKDPDKSWAEIFVKLKATGVHYFLTHHSELEVFSPTIPEIEALVRQSGTLIHEFSPYRPGVHSRPVYDRVDGYFFPLSGFREVDRPGPLVRLYRLN